MYQPTYHLDRDPTNSPYLTIFFTASMDTVTRAILFLAWNGLEDTILQIMKTRLIFTKGPKTDLVQISVQNNII